MTILLAEDSSFYQRMISEHLRSWGFDFVSARDGKEAWKFLSQQNAPRLALLDWVLPEIEGIEICRRLRTRSEETPYTYTVMLTAKSQKQEMLEAMDAGADDFLLKPFDPPELKARLLVGKRIVELQQKLVSANEALHFSATHDFLTRLWNRAEILEFLRREMVRGRRDGRPVGIILGDVDRFKRINDTFGHQTGDVVLQEVGRRLFRAVREYDGVGRYGGEEFLLVLPGCDLTTTIRRANELRSALSSQAILSGAGPMEVTISMGVAVPEAGENVEAVLSRADIALYDAKNAGRNQVRSSMERALVS